MRGEGGVSVGVELKGKCGEEVGRRGREMRVAGVRERREGEGGALLPKTPETASELQVSVSRPFRCPSAAAGHRLDSAGGLVHPLQPPSCVPPAALLESHYSTNGR